MVAVLIPHLRLPFRLTGGHLQVVEQDSDEDVERCVENALRFPLGSRIEEPTFGLQPQEFKQGGADPEQVRLAVEKWEPRVDTVADHDLVEMVDRVQLNVEQKT